MTSDLVLGSPTDLVAETVEDALLAAPDVFLHSVPELAVAVVQPQVFDSAERGGVERPRLGPVHVATLGSICASNLDKEVARSLVRRLEVPGAELVDQRSWVDAAGVLNGYGRPRARLHRLRRPGERRGQARGVRAPRRRGGRECERRAQPEEAYRLGSPRTPHCHVQAHKAHRLTTRQPLVQFEAVTLSRWLRASHLRASRPQARGDEEPAGRASCTRELGAWLPSGATHEANDRDSS